MADYTRQIASAITLIGNKGGPITIERTHVLGSGPNPVTGPTDSYTTTAVLLNYQQKYIDGTTIKRGDKRALIAAGDLTIELEETDKIVQGGITWNIEHLDSLEPDGESVIIYTAQLRS